MKILVAYATNAGSTVDVAQAVAEELGKDGAQVEVRQVKEITGLEGYDAVLVGAPMILGWHREAVGFVRRHHQALSRVPVAYFMLAMNLTQPEEGQNAGVPVWIDPRLPKPPQQPGRLSLKERWASVKNYLRPALQAAPDVRPVSIGFFGGKLDLFRLGWLQRLFVLIVIQAQPGDRRNWTAIREWAAGLRHKLAGASGI